MKQIIRWDKSVEAIKYSSRAKVDFRGYLVGMGIAIGSLILYYIDGTKANKANTEFQNSVDKWKEENVNEEEN